MQRDMDSIRCLLLAMEAEPSTIYRFDLEGVCDQLKWYQVHLLSQANLIEGVRVRWAADGTGPYPTIGGLVALTWEGHDFLDAVRDDSVWEQVNKKARSAGLDIQSLTFELIKSLGMSVITGRLGL